MNFRIARFTLIALLCLFFVKPSFAQIIKKQGFTIQLGVFRFPDKSRFVSLSDLGEVYTEELPNQLTRIRLGRYETRKQADSILKIVHQREYIRSIVVPTEFVVPVQQVPPVNVKTNPIPNDPNKPQKGGRLDRPPMARPAAYSIQIGANDKKIGLIDISTLDQIGRVYEVEQDSMKKVLVGMFNDKDSAEAQLKMVRNMGYKDAFLVETDVQDVLITLPSSPLNKDLTQTYRPIRNFETASFYKRMEGMLNNVFPVIVHAYFSSASITGFYDDPKSKMRKKFVYYGYRAGTNSLPETQFSSENGLVVKASASPKSESIKLSFTVKDIETNETLNFSLREIYPTGSVQFDIISIYKKKSQQGTNGELGADLYLEYPTIIGVGSKIVESKINTVASQLSNEVEGETMMNKVDVQLKDGIEKVLSYYPQYRWLSQTYETKVLENTKNLLSLRMSSELIIVEPQSKVIHKSFNLSNGSEIMLKEVLNAGFETPIANNLKEKIGRQYAKLRPPINEVKTSVEEMMKNYYFTSQGIVFFRDYQKNKALAEAIEITIPYSEIKLFINKNGFLGSFIK